MSTCTVESFADFGEHGRVFNGCAWTLNAYAGLLTACNAPSVAGGLCETRCWGTYSLPPRPRICGEGLDRCPFRWPHTDLAPRKT